MWTQGQQHSRGWCFPPLPLLWMLSHLPPFLKPEKKTFNRRRNKNLFILISNLRCSCTSSDKHWAETIHVIHVFTQSLSSPLGFPSSTNHVKLGNVQQLKQTKQLNGLNPILIQRGRSSSCLKTSRKCYITLTPLSFRRGVRAGVMGVRLLGGLNMLGAVGLRKGALGIPLRGAEGHRAPMI